MKAPPTGFFQPRSRPTPRGADMRLAGTLDHARHVLALARAAQGR